VFSCNVCERSCLIFYRWYAVRVSVEPCAMSTSLNITAQECGKSLFEKVQVKPLLLSAELDLCCRHTTKPIQHALAFETSTREKRLTEPRLSCTLYSARGTNMASSSCFDSLNKPKKTTGAQCRYFFTRLYPLRCTKSLIR